MVLSSHRASVRTIGGAHLATNINLAQIGTPLIVTNPKVWHLSKWTEPLEGGHNFFLNMKSLNLWAADEGVRGMGLGSNSILGVVPQRSFHPLWSHWTP